METPHSHSSPEFMAWGTAFSMTTRHASHVRVAAAFASQVPNGISGPATACLPSERRIRLEDSGRLLYRCCSNGGNEDGGDSRALSLISCEYWDCRAHARAWDTTSLAGDQRKAKNLTLAEVQLKSLWPPRFSVIPYPAMLGS
ncbi:uncharacterized protein LY79DRAFT_679601 [Colletotrichum navitas]|uniref:Uncharacterized protein n=1 Tax=Colletotrichum navitas TaxID=681940 RepID=A0AAD8PLI1_9PEZI|nr:uncharacterized protein LY79DRAFT_679601 [Colletotrichum navitas]KAK1569602.1 hypothetical protein LY79DRAFT_679601 [Colletotrichum navitas]